MSVCQDWVSSLLIVDAIHLMTELMDMLEERAYVSLHASAWSMHSRMEILFAQLSEPLVPTKMVAHQELCSQIPRHRLL